MASSLSVAIFDLDNFKQINDRYGHPAGDTLLKQFATELRTFFRATDIVSRWGGDEFLVIVDCSDEDVRDRIEPVRKWVDGDYTIIIGGEARKVSVRASVGVGVLAARRNGRGLGRARGCGDVPGERPEKKGRERVPRNSGYAKKNTVL